MMQLLTKAGPCTFSVFAIFLGTTVSSCKKLSDSGQIKENSRPDSAGEFKELCQIPLVGGKVLVRQNLEQDYYESPGTVKQKLNVSEQLTEFQNRVSEASTSALANITRCLHPKDLRTKMETYAIFLESDPLEKVNPRNLELVVVSKQEPSRTAALLEARRIDMRNYVPVSLKHNCIVNFANCDLEDVANQTYHKGQTLLIESKPRELQTDPNLLLIKIGAPAESDPGNRVSIGVPDAQAYSDNLYSHLENKFKNIITEGVNDLRHRQVEV